MLNLKAGNCQKQSQLFSVHLNQLYMHDTGALQRVHHSVSAWVKLDLCLFRFVEQLLQLVHIRVLPHLQTNERRNKWAKFIICPSWSFWLREGVGGNWVMGWRGGLAPSFGIQGPPLRSSRADRVIPMNSGDLPPPSHSLDFSMYLPSWICSARVLLIGPEAEQSVGSLIVEREAGCSVTTNKE